MSKSIRRYVGCIEPLERRQLLSSVLFPSHPGTETKRAEVVQLVERDSTANDGTDISIAVQKVPTKVLDALSAKFPGSEVLAATYNSDDGPEYDLTARFSGRTISATLKPNGRIIETGESVLIDELPPVVLNWVRQNLSSGQIDEAALVAKGNSLRYELLVGVPDKAGFDISLRVRDALTSPVLDRTEPFLPDDAGSQPSESPALPATLFDAKQIFATSASDRRDIDLAEVFASDKRLILRFDTKPHDAPAPQRADLWELPVLPLAAITPTANQQANQASLIDSWIHDRSTKESVRPSLTLAARLAEFVPIDFRAVELRMLQTQKAITSLVEKLVTTAATQSNTWHLSLLGAFITVGQLALAVGRRNRRSSVRVSNVANASWSWVLGKPGTPRNQA